MPSLRSILNRLVFGGTSRLQPHEIAVLNALAPVLSTSDRSVLTQQVSAVSTVQRFLRGRQLNIFFGGANPPMLSNLSGDFCLGRLKAQSVVPALSVRVVTHHGRLSSLEFSRSPSRAFTGPYEPVPESTVVSGSSLPSATDRLEHGRT